MTTFNLFATGRDDPLAQVHVNETTIEVILGHGAYVGTHFKLAELEQLIQILQQARERAAG